MNRASTGCRSHKAAAAVVVLYTVWTAWASGEAVGRIESPIIFAQLPADSDIEREPSRSGGMLRADYGRGGRIVRLDPDGRQRVLTEAFGSACEFDVSFDAERILFTAKRQPDDPWNIWEMDADGSDARRITSDLGNCRSPAYQATLYTIVSTEPWYQIMFVSDAANAMNEYGARPAKSLYSCTLDGSAVRRLTMNLSDDLDPFLMDDGRVLLASWQRMDLRRGLLGRVALFGINTDGTDYALFSEDRGRRIKHMPCVTSDGLVVFVEADRVEWDGGGQLGMVTARRPFHSYRTITDEPRRRFHSPSPLRDGTILVSVRPADGSGTYGVYQFHPRSGLREVLVDDPAFHELHSKVLAPRTVPDGRSSVVNEKYATGKLYGLNAYLTEPANRSYMQPGMIHRLRVIEGVSLRGDVRTADLREEVATAIGWPGATVNGMAPIVQKRLLGYAPVESDGSFYLELPADVPVQLQTLDANGMALRTCGWIWVKHREARGCIGCHEDPELAPENRFVQAVQRPATVLTLPVQKRRTVDFRRDVMPIVERKCTSCHAERSPGLSLSRDERVHFNAAYEGLLAAREPSVERGRRAEVGPAAGKYVHPGQARTSPLVWRLFGTNTSRRWDESYGPGQTFPVCPPSGAEPLTDEEKLTLIEWIDLGAHWRGTFTNGGGSAGVVGGLQNEGRE